MLDWNKVDALFRTEDGYLWAMGPWTVLKQLPTNPSLPCFLEPDFEAQGGRRWLMPQSFGVIGADELPVSVGGPMALVWDQQDASVFLQNLALAQDKMKLGEFKKVVPAFPWRAHFDGEFRLVDFLQAFKDAPVEMHPYFLRYEDRVVLGVTPERLFEMFGGTLRTQAVAGTSSAAQADELERRQKDLSEHEFVREFLAHSLRDLGTLRQAPRRTAIFGSLAHLVTDFELNLRDRPDIEELLDLLHPTPALGVFPRSESAVAFLSEIRKALQVDSCFGAPIGYVWKERICFLVGIRQVLIEGRSLVLHTGCGVIEESNPEQEWEELKLKREAVCKILNLAI